MAVSSLRCRPNATQREENKLGFVVFAGDPQESHRWLFRTQLKVKTSREEDTHGTPFPKKNDGRNNERHRQPSGHHVFWPFLSTDFAAGA